MYTARAEAPQPCREPGTGPGHASARAIPCRPLALRLGPQFLVSLLMHHVHQIMVHHGWPPSCVLVFRRSSGWIKAEMRRERQWTTQTEQWTKRWTTGVVPRCTMRYTWTKHRSGANRTACYA